ncbi:MAG: hypothetical protein ABIC04_00135 [Nanoarchaeota archaeon]
MNKKAVTMTFPVIITAIIALVILIVMLAIYTGFIGKTTNSINEPANEAGLKATDAAWCMSAYLKGDECVIEGALTCGNAGTGCTDAVPLPNANKKCELTCPDTSPYHKVAGGNKDKTYSCDTTPDPAKSADPKKPTTKKSSPRYCCCSNA